MEKEYVRSTSGVHEPLAWVIDPEQPPSLGARCLGPRRVQIASRRPWPVASSTRRKASESRLESITDHPRQSGESKVAGDVASTFDFSSSAPVKHLAHLSTCAEAGEHAR